MKHFQRVGNGEFVKEPEINKETYKTEMNNTTMTTNAETIPEGGKKKRQLPSWMLPGYEKEAVVEKEEDLQEGWKDDSEHDQSGGWSKGNIRNFGKLGPRTEVRKEDNHDRGSIQNGVDMDRMDRVGRMRMMREKLRQSRRRSDQTPISNNMELKAVKQTARTMRGHRLLASTRMENERIQKADEKVIIGADVEGLYPALRDLEVAAICYKAVIDSNIVFQNIEYKKLGMYLAMNLTVEEAMIHPLGRVLPTRRSNGGSRPWVTGVLKDAEKMWRSREVDWTEMEKKVAVAEMVRIGVICMMNTHTFLWDGRWFLQRKGGPIGLRGTCAVARVVMLWWDGQLENILANNNIRLEEGARYMDDIRLLLNSIKEGWRWDGTGLAYCRDWQVEDENSGETTTQRTGRVLKDIMNSIISFLNLTIEIEDDFDDKKLPTLDIKIWYKGGKVLHEHFEKVMKTNLVLEQRSALNENTKMSSLSQKVVRILLNCSEELDNDSRVKHLEEFSTKLSTSGYKLDYIRKVMENGIKAYERKLDLSNLPKTDEKFSPLHLPKAFKAGARRDKKMMAKSEWFKGGKKDDMVDNKASDGGRGGRNPGRNRWRRGSHTHG